MGVDKSVCSMHAIYNCKLCEKSAMRVVEAVSAVRMCFDVFVVTFNSKTCLLVPFSFNLSLSRSMSIYHHFFFIYIFADFAIAPWLRLLRAAQPSGLQEVLWMTLARRGLESHQG